MGPIGPIHKLQRGGNDVNTVPGLRMLVNKINNTCLVKLGLSSDRTFQQTVAQSIGWN